ncbi:PPE domain-containing protein [Nocardia sp. NRRL S-836]|uniref:PPE domain-containing protein n=1 Tax=Nocardia sp. NRRL S-836 TaxID=1519492 RepID=UPI000AD9D095|nr:PPE domain-containing protein [Nocardia sp. NRRL S-836]
MSRRGHGGGHGGNGGHGHDDKDKWNREDIHEPVDWMTYTHEQLYNMVHTGVNLESANAAATSWSKIGEDIAAVRENLLKAVEDSTVGWDGESARLARDGLTEVTNWVHDTATYAQKVSSAITTETSNVEAARAAMPPPPKAPEPPVPTPTPTPVEARPQLISRLRQQQELQGVADADAFSGTQNPRLVSSQTGAFAGFDTVGTSAVENLAAADASHRLAADVMAAFQRNSAAVDQTVPSQFTPPVNPVNPVLVDSGTGTRTPSNPDGTTPGGGAGGGAAVTPTPQQNRGTTNASRGGGNAGGFGGGRGGGGGGGFTGGVGFGRIPAANQNNQSGSSGGTGSPGGSAGVVGDGRSGAGAAAAASSAATGNQTRAFQNPLAMGAAPMAAGAPAAGGQNDEREHKSASYLEEDDNVFGLDRKAAPPVIGQ